MTTLERKTSLIRTFDKIIKSNDDLLMEQISIAINKILNLSDRNDIITENDMEITPFVASIGQNLSLPDNFDYDKERFDYLSRKYN
ncbi:MAG: hypothetical protein IJ250_05320 [Bacteroidales bacterium]|nr:hypothetical protein [Bacteroidales bacterium]